VNSGQAINLKAGIWTRPLISVDDDMNFMIGAFESINEDSSEVKQFDLNPIEISAVVQTTSRI
jgi:ureidoglycolate hydrolase